jgi:hypothetical protein
MYSLDYRKRGPPSPQKSSASKKGKTSAKDSIDNTNSILEGFENEIMCPMCVLIPGLLVCEMIS